MHIRINLNVVVFAISCCGYLSSFFKKLVRLVIQLTSREVYPRLLSKFDRSLRERYRRWYLKVRSMKNDPYGLFLRSGGDELLVSNLNIDTDCWVIDFGGFRGEWTAKILNRYQVKCLVVEPVPAYAKVISDRFKDRSDVRVMPFLFGRSEGTQVLYLAEDATGSFAQGLPVIVEQLPISRLMESIDQETVGAASINIEGGEYQLLEMLLESNEVSRFKTLLIQFHKTDCYSPERYLELQLGLAESHNLTWDYPFIWQRWDKK